MDLQPGDEVTIEVPSISCEQCNQEKLALGSGSHFLQINKGKPIGFFCADCADTEEKRMIPIEMIAPIMNDKSVPEPVQGSFKPIAKKLNQENSGLEETWKDRGHLFLETMAMWQGLVLKFSIGGNRYKGIWIKPTWKGRQVTALTFAGDTPSKGLELDLYQISRLRKLGLIESGATNKEWHLDLQNHEQDPGNAAAVIVHVLRQGYLLDPSDIYSVTPTLDVDFSDPEWRE